MERLQIMYFTLLSKHRPLRHIPFVKCWNVMSFLKRYRFVLFNAMLLSISVCSLGMSASS